MTQELHEIIKDSPVVSADEVRGRYLEISDQRLSTYLGLINLYGATQQATGWKQVELPIEHVLSVLLQRHKHGEIEIVPWEGKTVREVAKHLSSIKNEYDFHSPECAATLDYFAERENIDPIFLARKPLDAWIGLIPLLRAYSPLKWDGEQLVHLDGLHRMIEFGLHPDKYAGQNILSYVAMN